MRRALCVGIDDYCFGPLEGCVDDAERIATLLSTHEDGRPNFDCAKLVAPAGAGKGVVTRASLIKAIEGLFSQPAEVVLLHFSGHGTVSNLGGFLATQDAKRYEEGVSVGDLLVMANESRADEVVIIIDCCQSGALGEIPAIRDQMTLLREGVAILAANRGDQPSIEGRSGGLFSWLVADALAGSAADIVGDVTASAIYANVETALNAWDQRPLFKAHVSKMTALRKCKPPIDMAVLLDLPALFPAPEKEFPLCPEYEESFPRRDVAKTSVFAKLQALNRVHLVVPVDARHMYDAAMQSKSCRLTAAGRYYWRLAKTNRI